MVFCQFNTRFLCLVGRDVISILRIFMCFANGFGHFKAPSLTMRLLGDVFFLRRMFTPGAYISVYHLLQECVRKTPAGTRVSMEVMATS